MNKKIQTVVGFFILTVAVSGATSYWVVKRCSLYGTQNRHHTSAENAHRWLHEANLTPEQIKKLTPLETNLKHDLDILQTKIAEQRISICSILMESDGIDKKLSTMVNRVAELEGTQQKLIIQHLLAMRDIMTPVQKEKFFTAIMKDICVGCRSNLCSTSVACMCGHCDNHG